MMLRRHEDSARETYYDVLSVEEGASYDKIRAHYKAAILSFHPDKLSGGPESEHHRGEGHEKFLKIQRAWEVLGDAESRAAYDRELKAASPASAFPDEVELIDMTINNDSGGGVELVYPCRCGDNFSITSRELAEMGLHLGGDKRVEILETGGAPLSVSLPCSSCSLSICLTVNLDC